jgi:restriction system protein
MEEAYLKEIIQAANSKLITAGKSLTELELIPGILKRLKSKLGKKDLRHTSKVRFKKEYFKDVIDTKEWLSEIVQLSDKRYILKIDKDKYVSEKTEDLWHWSDLSYDDAIRFKLENLKNINPFKLEKLVSNILNKIYTDFTFNETRKTGDGGIDVIGVCKSENVKEAVYVQVKKFKGTVSRDKANEFHGTIVDLKRQKDFNKIIGLFITTGSFSSTFEDFLKKNEDECIKYLRWNGEELSRQMLKHGLGVRYSIDPDFWSEVDSTAVLRSKSDIKQKNKN